MVEKINDPCSIDLDKQPSPLAAETVGTILENYQLSFQILYPQPPTIWPEIEEAKLQIFIYRKHLAFSFAQMTSDQSTTYNI